MLLDRVRLIIGFDINDYAKDDVLAEIIANQTNIVNLFIGVQELPIELEFIVVETSVARYNQLGSEGIDSEGVDSLSHTYSTDIMSKYIPYMQTYKERNVPNVPLRRLRML